MSATLTLEAVHCSNGVYFTVEFYGTDAQAEANAIAWYERKKSTHAVSENPDNEATWIDYDRFPALYNLLNPLCEHGLSAHLCAGPQHYPYDDEERQHYGF